MLVFWLLWNITAHSKHSLALKQYSWSHSWSTASPQSQPRLPVKQGSLKQSSATSNHFLIQKIQLLAKVTTLSGRQFSSHRAALCLGWEGTQHKPEINPTAQGSEGKKKEAAASSLEQESVFFSSNKADNIIVKLNIVKHVTVTPTIDSWEIHQQDSN